MLPWQVAARSPQNRASSALIPIPNYLGLHLSINISYEEFIFDRWHIPRE